MSHLDTKEAFAHFRDRTLEGIQSHFPMKGKFQTLHLDKVEAKDDLHPDDIRGQHKAKLAGESFAVPIYGHMRLVDNATGTVVDQRKIRLAELPKTTQRYSYILNGREYQFDNQWQLKPGAYTRRRQNGELETRFNVVGKSAFDMVFDPGTKQLRVDYNKAKLPVYPLLKSLGVDDDSIEKHLGKEVLEANKAARGLAGTLEKFYKTEKRVEAPSKAEAEKHFIETMQASKMKPEATAITLGKPLDHVNGEAMLLAAKKLMQVQAGHPEDDRDSLIFKDLRSGGDYVYDKMRGAAKSINLKSMRKLNTAKNIHDIIKFDTFNEPVKQAFNKNSACNPATQINPIEMIAKSQQTTIMGPGGIKSEQQIMQEAKFVNPSHLGYLDPINTPEGSKTGVSLRLPVGVKKVGNQPMIPLYNLKTGHTEDVPPGTFFTSKVVLPDQITWKDGKPHAISATVKMAGHGNDIVEGKLSEAQYAMRHPSQLFDMTSNLIPYLGNSNGNRASMATRHMEQSISLLHREAPLVQVSTGVDKHGMRSFEEVVGSYASHSTPIAGTVKQVKDDGIVIHGDSGITHEVQIYNNYPLNDAKSVLHSTPVVKVGDKVKSGQLVADTNFSKNGSIALGTNLRVAYMPFKGYNFEDGVVISDSAARKLSSVHLYKPSLATDGGVKLSKSSFLIHQPGIYSKDQIVHIGDDGLPKMGSKVKPGDPLILAVKPFSLKDRTGEAAIRKSLTGAHTDRSLKWDGETEGEVVGIAHNKDGVHIHVKTIEPMQVGDKMAGRYGNKGIITMVLPDKEMPHTKDGKHIEVALNPSGIPGRMNVGQVLETALSKVALKTGKPIVVPSFTKDADVIHHVQDELKKHGISDTEELHDPGTGQSLGQTLVGFQHIIKLVHQVDKKVAVSSGMPAPHNPATYDINLQPKHGQRIGSLGLYAMLAHGAKANLREMQTWKGEGPDDASKAESKRWPSQHGEVWKAIQTGSPLPTPKSTFAFKKFEDLLKGSGVNIEKQGNQFMVSPLTDRHILAMTEARALPKAGERLEAKIDKKTGELKARTGGLFDEKLTGGHGGQKWSRIDLAEPIPNPVFERPIMALTGLSGKDYMSLVSGEKGIHSNGQLADVGRGAITGGAAIKQLLQNIDVKKDLAKSSELLKKAKPSEIDKTLKKVKYLQALDKLDMKPSEAYVLHHVPVLPPSMRPASPMADGNVKYADINQLYSDFAQVNEQLKDPILSRNLTDDGKKELRRNLYDGMKALTGYGVPYSKAEHKGLLHQLSGASPKTGFFQNVLAQKRQDLTMRSTIVPEPALGLDEMGLPKHHAIDLFRPFIVKKLQDMGAAPTPLDAQKLLLKTDNPHVHRALEKVMEERPVMLKRDPVLHKYGIQGFNAKIVEGNAIKIHPLVVGGFNADFDGDTMSVFVPISKEAVAEVHKMKPSQNIFAESSGNVAYMPSLESALGVYKLSLKGKDTGKSFKNPGEILSDVKSGSLHYADVVSLNGKKTTAGRVLLSTTMPEAMQSHILHDIETPLDKKGLSVLASTLGKNHKEEFDKSINKLKDLGNHASFGIIPIPMAGNTAANLTDPKKNVFVPIGTHTLSLKDFIPDAKMRDEVLDKAHGEVVAIKKLTLTPAEQHRRVVDVYMKADQKMHEKHDEKMKDNPSNLYMMHKAGMKPEWNQYKQMVIAPMLVQDSANRTIATPVDRSYSEGLDLASYWTQMHGARRGTVMKVQETSGPGALSKLLMASTMDMMVASPDCGTTRGILLGVGEKDIHDRVLAQDYKSGHIHLAAGSTLTPDVVGKVRAADKNAKMLVRSPLKCEHDHGLCQKCVGLSANGDFHPMGTNIGIIATQTIGERAVQLPMKAFHTGGVAEQGGGKAVDKFSMLEQLTMLPKKIANAATLAMRSGKIDKIDPTSTGVNVSVGGFRHFIGKDTAGNALHKPLGLSDWGGLHVGMHVDAGSSLSDPTRTVINPHDLYAATGSIDKVQNHLASEIYDVYRDEGIKRRHIETVVKAMSNLTKIVHPGDAEGILRGEFQPLSVIQKKNSDLVKQGLRPIEHTPTLKGVNMLPLSLQEDWMAKLQHQKLKTTISDAAAISAISHLHGTHPIPGMVYGAEFGVTSEKSNLPGYGHLKNVPKANY
jgi:DNA-directed RNA polymerase subunit beta'